MTDMRAWRRAKDGTLLLRIRAGEAFALQQIATDLASIVAAPPDGNIADRLYPRAYLDPTEEAAELEFQSLVHEDLSSARVEALQRMAIAVHEVAEPGSEKIVDVAIAAADEITWVTALNDARLVVGTTLDVDEESETLYDPDDPRFELGLLYQWLGLMQQDLVDVLSEELPEEGTAG
jgi:hypothetical protein